MADAFLAPTGAVWSRRNIGGSQTTVFVESLQVDAVVGVYPHEKDCAQPICIDLEILLNVDFDKNGADQLAATLDYDWAVKQVLTIVGHAPVDLLETLAYRIADNILWHPLADIVKLRIAKLGVIPGARVGVALQANRRPGPELQPNEMLSPPILV